MHGNGGPLKRDSSRFIHFTPVSALKIYNSFITSADMYSEHTQENTYNEILQAMQSQMLQQVQSRT